MLKGAISGGDKGRNKEQFHQYALANVRVQQKYDHLRLAKTELHISVDIFSDPGPAIKV